MKSILETLTRISKDFAEVSEIHEATVIGAWKGAIGESLGKHTKPVSLSEKRLIVYVRDLAWKGHLESLATQIVFKINSTLNQPAVKFIEFRPDRFGKHFVDESILADIEKKRREAALNEITNELRESALQIKDKDLREKFILAAGSSLARKKRLNL